MINNKKAVIHVVVPHLNGGLFDAFEYYSYMFNYNDDVYLYLLYTDKFRYSDIVMPDNIFNIFEDKYNINNNVFNNIKIIKPFNKMVKDIFNRFLYLDNHTFKYSSGRLNALYNYFIIDPVMPTVTDYKKIKNSKYCKIYSELLNYKDDLINIDDTYAEYIKKEFLIGIPYKQKLNFDIFKKYNKFENNAFITFVSKGVVPYEILINEIYPLIEDKDKLLISIKEEQYKNLDSKYLNDKKLEFLVNHPKDFHTLFNTYIYYHTGYFDPHPRMFHECIFYNKNIIYINKNNIKDGGYYRYLDAINNGLLNHSMNINDDIIGEFIKW